MQLTRRLLSFINGVFDKDAREFLALRLQYTGGSMSWSVQDATLTTVVAGGPGLGLSIDLTQYSIAQLASFLNAQPGYSVPFADTSSNSLLGARTLIDDGHNIADSNGDHLYAYSNVLWAYLESVSNELQQAQNAIGQMLLQMSLKTASLNWLDEIGGYYGIPRSANEPDQTYGPRIVAEVIRPRTNNIAISNAITFFTGQAVSVTDYVGYGGIAPLHNGTITHDGTHTYSSTSQPLYGLFDVSFGYDLEHGGSPVDFQAAVTTILGRLRAAGTQLHALVLANSQIQDVAVTPTDVGAMPLVAAPSLADVAVEPTDDWLVELAYTSIVDSVTNADDTGGISMTVTADYMYDGTRTYNAFIQHLGVGPETEIV